MGEYITKNNAISAVCFGCNQEFSDKPCEPSECSIRQSIMALPTADVVKVVRCKDCKHKNPNCYKCLRDNLWHDAEDFCSYGERR